MSLVNRVFVLGFYAFALVFATGGYAADASIKPIYSSLAADSTIVDEQANVIVDSYGALDGTLNRLRECRDDKSGVVSILHLGDSHLQAGFLSEHIRAFFQTSFGNAGRGLIAPLKLIGTNEPSDYTIASTNRWTGVKSTDRVAVERAGITGITGMAMCTEDSDISITISAGQPFSVVRLIHHEKAPLMSAPTDLGIGIECPADNQENMTTVYLNRSVTSVTLTGRAEGAYGTGCFYGFMLENGESGVLYNASGVNGATFSTINSGSSIAQQSALLAPDMIILSLGTNDAYGAKFDYEQAYANADRTIRELRENNPEVAILLVAPQANCRRSYYKGKVRYKNNDNMRKMNEIIKELAGHHRAAYWDLFLAAGAEKSCENWTKLGLFQTDILHLTKKGYQVQAEMFAHAFSKLYNNRFADKTQR